jgi:iron complex outermembrane recepter protein
MPGLSNRISLLALTAAIAPGSVAFAQNTPLIQPEILVTVQKREQDLRDVPINLTALSGELLSDLGLEEFDALSRFTPGFVVQEQSVNNPGFVMRGITSDSGEATTEPRVAVFQDGVSISKSRGSIVELFDVERVEIAKGPQATLFGRGALIGGVNVIQNKADFDLSYKATLGAGNFGEVFAEGIANIPFLEDKFAARLAMRYKRRDGYVESANPREDDFNGTDMAAVRLALRLDADEALRFDVIFNYQKDTPPGTAFKSGSFLPTPGGSLAPWEAANLNTFGGFEDGRALGIDRTVTGLTVLADWDLGEGYNLNAILAYREFESLEIFDPDGFGLPLFVFAEDAYGEQYSNELRLSYDEGEDFAWFVGASWLLEEGFQRVPLLFDERATQALLAGPGAGLLVAPNVPPVGALPGFNLGVFLATGAIIPLKPLHLETFTNDAKTISTDVFADVTWRVTDKLDLTGGVRYTRDDKESGLTVVLDNGPSAISGRGLFVQPTNGRITEEAGFDGLTWRAAATYRWTEDWNVYATIGTGRRPDVIATSAGDPAARFSVVPAEEVTSYEVGAKGLILEGNLSLDGSVFFYEYDNFQAGIINAQGLLETINAGTATSSGFEGQAIWNATNALSLIGTYGYNKARFDDSFNGRPAQFAGNSFRLSPDHSVSLAARWVADLGGFGTLSVLPSYTWQSEVFFDNDNDPIESEDSYGLLNLSVKLTSPTERWTAEIYGSNLTDEDYIIDAGNTGGSFGIPTFIAGPPLFWGVRLSASY